MTRRLLYAFAVSAALLAGCDRDAADDSAVLTPMPSSLAGVYVGQLPCSNCAAIAATLWLRPDGRFILRQRFEGDSLESGTDTRGMTVTYGLGRWHWDEREAQAVLQAPGPERRLAVLDTEHLALRVAAPVEHVLTLDRSAPLFTDRVMLDGESTTTERGATFSECLTGLSWVVTEGGAYRDLRRQHRRLNPGGKVALTTVEGHLVTVGSGATRREQLVVDRFITLKPGKGC